MANSVLMQRQQDLTTGYIREECIDNDKVYPLELNKIVSDFLGNIFIKFDIVEKMRSKELLQENGKLVKTIDALTSSCNVGCSFCMEEGVTLIEIECVKPSTVNNVIGITSNIKACKKGVWISSQKAYKYWWYNQTGIFAEKDNQRIEFFNIYTKWSKGDIIGMKIDMNDWTITFFLNKQEKHKMSIAKDIKYFLMMTVQSNIEYRLL